MINHHQSLKTSRAFRVRQHLSKGSDHLRLSVFRSNQYLWAQIIDDTKGETLVSASTKNLTENQQKLPKIKQAELVGKLLAKRAKKISKQLKFDRGPYKFHGRLKALAKAARQGGLKF
jgi:large subunit ribosomal protein L18